MLPLRPAGSLCLSDAELDALNKQIMETVQTEGRVFLTATVICGRFALRACILHYGTSDADTGVLVDIVREVGARLAASQDIDSHRTGR